MKTERAQAARDYIDACVTDNLWIDPAAVSLATDLTGKELESFIYCAICDFVWRSNGSTGSPQETRNGTIKRGRSSISGGN